ncbi:MAG: TorF family putative porin [Brachymonas sp.]
MKFSTLSLAAVMSLAAAGAFAQAKAPEPDYTLSFNVGAVTDYRFRGLAQTARKPAIQGGVDFSHKSGIYLGAWGSNVKWIKDFNLATKGSLEVDLYGGYKGSIAGDLGFDLGAIAYRYPGNNSGAAGTPGAGTLSNANTTEVYGALTYKMFTAKYSRSTGNFLGFLTSEGSDYFDLSAAFDVGNGFTVTPHVGVQKVKNNPNYDYTDYSLTVAKDLGNGLSVSGAVVGTNAKKAFYTDVNGKFLGNGALVLGLKYSF